jgi:hypothetical protein
MLSRSPNIHLQLQIYRLWKAQTFNNRSSRDNRIQTSAVDKTRSLLVPIKIVAKQYHLGIT